MSSVRLHLRMGALLVVTIVSLRRRTTSETLRRLTARGGPWPQFAHTEGMYAVRRFARVLRANCLSQSVALTVALTRAQQEPTLVLGCRRYADRNWGAHAWVEIGSTVLDALPSGEHAALAWLDGRNHWVAASRTGGAGV